MYSRIRVTVNDNSDRALVEMFAASAQRLKRNRRFNNPTVITE